MRYATFSVRPIPDEIWRAARATLKSPQYGHPAHVEIAGGTGPCRQCLRTFDVGNESRILFTYNPFDGIDPYPSPGPIFIHLDPCSTYANATEFPAAIRALPLIFEGYDGKRWVVARERVTAGRTEAAELAIQKIFQQPDVDYIHVRHGDAGCFIAQIDRAIVEAAALQAPHAPHAKPEPAQVHP
jgi:hypothetical protein